MSIGKAESGLYSISAKLHVHIPKLSVEDAQKLVEEAHQICPYSIATRDNIEVEVKAV